MPRYKCLIRGENFLMDTEAGPELMGFYTTRFIRGMDETHAEMRCLKKLMRIKEYRRKFIGEDRQTAKVIFKDIQMAQNQFSFSFGKGNVFFYMSDADENGEHHDCLDIELEAHKDQ